VADVGPPITVMLQKAPADIPLDVEFIDISPILHIPGARGGCKFYSLNDTNPRLVSICSIVDQKFPSPQHNPGMQ